jgi:predicted MFS family arabinose efflux permease
LAAFALAKMNLGWQVKMAFILVPTFAYGLLFLGRTFPPTERVQQGVSTAGMYKAILRPLFLVLLFCMILTASTELATNQWLAYILSNTAGMAAGGILVLVWINGLMAVGRLFAGPIVHRISPIGLLVGSAAISAVGLVTLSLANSPATAIAAATVFAIGICYFWPTMLGVTSERFPEGGALALAIIGGTGTFAVAIFTWVMGGIYDNAGPRLALRYMAILPLILIVIFTGIWLYDKAQGGYKVVKLAADQQPE